MNTEDEVTKAGLRSQLSEQGIPEEEIIRVINSVDDYLKRHEHKLAITITVEGGSVELLTDNALILIRGTPNYGDPLSIKDAKPDTTFAFFDQFSLEGVKRALSSPYTGEALLIDDLVSLSEFIQASLLHDFVVYGDVLFEKEDSESKHTIEPPIDSTIGSTVSELPYLYEDYMLRHSGHILSLHEPTFIVFTPPTLELNTYDVSMAHFYSLVFDRLSKLNGSIYVCGKNVMYMKMISGEIDRESKALANRLYEKFQKTINAQFQKTITELGITNERLTMPLFTDYVIAQCADGRTDGILHVVKDIRCTLGDSFRAYAAQLNNKFRGASPQKILELEEEIENSFNRIISGKKGSQVKVLQPIAFIVALLRLDIPGMISAAKDIQEFSQELVTTSRNASVRLFEESYTNALKPDQFYGELRRVFRNVSFSRVELEKRLGPKTS